MIRLAKTLLRHRSALSVLTMVNLKTTVATTRLGWLWWVLDPLLMMWIYYFMVKGVFDKGGDDYHLFVLTGIISWQFFSKTVLLTALTLEGNRRVLAHIKAPLELFLVVPAVIQAFFALIGYAIIAVWHGAPSLELLCVLPVMLVIALFGTALGAVMAVWVVFLADVGKFLDYGLRVGFFLSPVLYPAAGIADVQGLPQAVKILFSLNPMAWTMTQLRGVMLYHAPFDAAGLALWLAAGLAALQAALWVVRANQRDAMKRMLRD